MNQPAVFSPTRFFAITFLVTWGCWFAAPHLGDAEAGDGTFVLLMLAGLLTPFATALHLTLTSRSGAMKSAFFEKLLDVRLIRPGILALFLLLFPASMVVSILVSTAFGLSLDQFALADGFSFSVGSVPTFLLLILAACFEELGWRGYGVESLGGRRSYFAATAIFGVLWSLWHLPMFFIPGSYQAELLEKDLLLALNFFVGIVPLAFIISWFCKKNGGSILGAVLVHAIVNFTQEFLQVSPWTKVIQTGVLVVMAAAFVMADPEVFFGASEGPERIAEVAGPKGLPR